MSSFNRVILMGNMTRDPDLKMLQGNNCVLNFSIGINKIWYDRNRQKQQKSAFPSCVAWNSVARFISQYFRKGSPILLEGELQTRTYEDTRDRSKHYVTEILVSRAEFAGGSGAQQTRQAEPETPPCMTMSAEEFMDMQHQPLPFDDVPF